MAASNTAAPSNSDAPSTGRAITGNALLFGLLSGGFLAATAYYKIVIGDDSAVIVFGPLVAFSWIVAGFFSSRRALSTGSGALTGLLAAIIGVAIGAAVDQWLAHAFITQWVTRLNGPCSAPDGHPYLCVDAATQLARETQATVQGAIILPVVGLLCGFLGGLIGPGNGIRSSASEEGIPTLDEDGRPLPSESVPLIKSYRAGLRSDGAQRTDSPDLFGS